ncbi:hypothetical protein, partial [Curtobacterium sp. CT11-133]|uniref:hypothetical protein n=1 Tax=Curtobacterium sp. CT11-133 TaxID=3243014 RepID=UPI0039B09BBE
VYMLRVLGAVASPPRPPALTILVTAHDRWWAVRYPDDASGAAFVTANEIHIPVGTRRDRAEKRGRDPRVLGPATGRQDADDPRP